MHGLHTLAFPFIDTAHINVTLDYLFARLFCELVPKRHLAKKNSVLFHFLIGLCKLLFPEHFMRFLLHIK